MSPRCPRCEITFEQELSRCPVCGWDFCAHILPENFLKSPLDFSPLKDFGKFLIHNAPLIWINGITLQVLWAVTALIIFRLTYLVLLLFPPGQPLYAELWIAVPSLIFASILFFPAWATYLFGLLRRYRYHVPVELFAVFAPFGRSRYGESLAWAPNCVVIGILLTALLVVPGVVFFSIFVPFLLLMHLDKLNVSRQRRRCILIYVFKKLWWIFLLIGIVLTAFWTSIFFTGWAFGGSVALIALLLFIPLQSVFSVLLYESLLGRENLDSL